MTRFERLIQELKNAKRQDDTYERCIGFDDGIDAGIALIREALEAPVSYDEAKESFRYYHPSKHSGAPQGRKINAIKAALQQFLGQKS
jgi:hypothetical protein